MTQKSLFKKLFLFGLICVILTTSGCTGMSRSNVTAQQTLLPVSPADLPTSQSTPIPTPPVQNLTEVPPVTMVTTVTPHFTGTIKYGENRSSALTEDQAWKSAEEYLGKYKIRNITSDEVEPLGQHTWIYENGTQAKTWDFQVNRMRFGANTGGIIIIDAYDGHVIYMGLFQ